jgi:hypothetical protein
MKKRLLTSLLTLTASLAYAGSGCSGGGCDTDKKEGTTDFTQSNTIIAGSGCGGAGCDTDKKDDKKDG